MSGEVEKSTVRVYVMGKECQVPAGLTIMKAMEYAGYRFTRGCGCRGGFCGACSTLYRVKGDYKLHAALACQTTVEDGMYLAQLPFVPANKAEYRIGELSPDASTLLAYYPETARCVSCNACTKACPQEIQVMDAVQAALRGDLEAVSDVTFDCIKCGLCVVRCPAEIPQYHMFQLARRLYGKYLQKPAEHVKRRVREIDEGRFDEEIGELTRLDKEQLVRRYEEAQKNRIVG